MGQLGLSPVDTETLHKGAPVTEGERNLLVHWAEVK